MLSVGSSLKSKSKKDWKPRLICVRQRKESGYAQLEVYRNTKTRPQFQTPAGVIPLAPELVVYYPFECPHTNVLVVEGPDEIIYLSCKSEDERTKWANDIQKLEIFKEDKLTGGETFPVMCEDNIDLRSINGTGDCILAIDTSQILLAKLRSKEMVARWPLACVKRYWSENSKFSITTGRRSPRGAGSYTFLSSEADKIFHVLDTSIQEMAKKLNPSSKYSESPHSNTGADVPPPNVHRPPAIVPHQVPMPATVGSNVQSSSVGYLEIPPEGFPGANNPPLSGEYSRTVHNVDPQTPPTDPEQESAYNVLQHVQGDRSKTWRSATLDSKAEYEVAKHHRVTGAEPIYNIAFVGSEARNQKNGIQQQQQTVSSPTSSDQVTSTAQNPTYLMTVMGPETTPTARDGGKQFKSSLLMSDEPERSVGKPLERSYSSVKYDEKLKKKHESAVEKKHFSIDDDNNGTIEGDENEETENEMSLSTSPAPPPVPPRRYNTKSECEVLDLVPPPDPPPSRNYSKSECEELLLDTPTTPPELPERDYTTSSDV